MHAYLDAIAMHMHTLRTQASHALATGAAWAADTVEADGIIRVFGSGHAGILADETFYRAGGLACVSPIRIPGLLTTVRPITAATERERRDGYATHSLENQRLDPGDLVVVHSASGRNAAPVEVALWARERGARTIGITSVAFSQAGSPRNALGRRLHEMVDLVIDTGMPPGDAAVRLPGLAVPVGPTSTILGAAAVHALLSEACRLLVERGVEPPVFTSSNIDGGDERNRALLERYAGRVDYL
jgi:uncharacterized phosphosugar-binding protein